MRRFSFTVRFGKMPRPSGIVHTPMRASASVPAPFTCRPAMCTQPAVGVICPLITFSVVVFPPPFGPSRATTLPTGTTRSTPWSTSMRPYAAFTPLSSRTFSAIGGRVLEGGLLGRGAEVRVEHRLVLLDLLGGADREDGAEVEHVDPRAHAHDQRDVVLDHEDGHALGREVEQQVGECVGLLFVLPRR